MSRVACCGALQDGGSTRGEGLIGKLLRTKIDGDSTKWKPRSLQSRCSMTHLLLEQQSVGQARQGVVKGQVLYLGLSAFALADVVKCDHQALGLSVAHDRCGPILDGEPTAVAAAKGLVGDVIGTPVTRGG